MGIEAYLMTGLGLLVVAVLAIRTGHRMDRELLTVYKLIGALQEQAKATRDELTMLERTVTYHGNRLAGRL